VIATRLSTRLLIVAGLAAWLLAVGAGLSMLSAYAGTPGPPATAAATWPAAASVARDTRTPVLLLFLHPHCPCSRATVGELARLLAVAQAPVATYAFFYRPADAEAGWERTDLWDSAAAIPGVHVISDERGAQARMFGAFVSGQALLYSASGSLLFSGGITGARGHEGDNPGRTVLTSMLTGQRTAPAHTPVFGCYLHGEADLVPGSPTSQAQP
jgi:hypothetical protein